MRNLCLVGTCLACLIFGHFADAKTWIDEDGASFVVIEKDTLKIVETSNFYWFDKLFELASKGDSVLLCFREGNTEGLGTACVIGPVSTEVINKGKVRAITFEAPGSDFIYRATETALEDGQIMKVSATDGDIFYSAILHKDYTLTEDAKAALRNETSTGDQDAKYALSQNYPVKLGSPDDWGGPKASRKYLSLLRDQDGQPVAFFRAKNVGAGRDGHILDKYEITTSSGNIFFVYIDSYHPDRRPEDQAPPTGFTLAKE